MNLRLPDDLHAQLAEAAKADTRSLNSEIVHLLRRALERRGDDAGTMRDVVGDDPEAAALTATDTEGHP